MEKVEVFESLGSVFIDGSVVDFIL
jgi:hypothetical protein